MNQNTLLNQDEYNGEQRTKEMTLVKKNEIVANAEKIRQKTDGSPAGNHKVTQRRVK
jgi:hypothetical protein